MLNKIEHLGIAVKDLDASNQIFEKLLGVKHYKVEEVESESVKTSFFKTGESKIELLEATDVNSVINKFIEKRGEGLHHVAFDVDNIEDEIERLKNEGFVVLGQPKQGADNKKVVFLHPKSTNGVLIELCQEIS